MKAVILAISLIFSLNTYANGGGTVGNGGDSVAINFKEVGRTLVAQLRFAAAKTKLPVEPELIKSVLEKAKVESTTRKLVLKGKRKDAINYPDEQRILIYAPGWRMLSIQDKRLLVLHELLGLMKINDETYALSLQLETTSSVETVPYFAGKDEDCSDENHQPKPGIIYDVRLTNILVISDIYSEGDREIYCTISVESADKVQRKFSASFSNACGSLFRQKKVNAKLRTVEDQICEIL